MIFLFFADLFHLKSFFEFVYCLNFFVLFFDAAVHANNFHQFESIDFFWKTMFVDFVILMMFSFKHEKRMISNRHFEKWYLKFSLTKKLKLMKDFFVNKFNDLKNVINSSIVFFFRSRIRSFYDFLNILIFFNFCF